MNKPHYSVPILFHIHWTLQFRVKTLGTCACVGQWHYLQHHSSDKHRIKWPKHLSVVSRALNAINGGRLTFSGYLFLIEKRILHGMENCKIGHLDSAIYTRLCPMPFNRASMFIGRLWSVTESLCAHKYSVIMTCKDLYWHLHNHDREMRAQTRNVCGHCRRCAAGKHKMRECSYLMNAIEIDMWVIHQFTTSYQIQSCSV